MIVLNLTPIGDRGRAIAAMARLAGQMNATLEETAQRLFDEFCRRIADDIKAFIDEINAQPVYTIHEMLEDRKLNPVNLYIVGGPAQVMAAPLGRLLCCTPHIPKHAEVANAVGAALARTTAEVTLLADTERKILTIGEDGCVIDIPRQFTVADAVRIGRERLREMAMEMGAKEDDLQIEVVEEQEFNMVKDFCTVGKNIRVKLQIKPGLISGYANEVGL